jgi:hypothetical protein
MVAGNPAKSDEIPGADLEDMPFVPGDYRDALHILLVIFL